MAGEEQRVWLAKVLGYQVAPSTGRSATSPRAIWTTAKETVDERLNALAAAIRSYDDETLQEIAERGLFAVGRGENVALMRALMEYDSAGETQRSKAADAVRKAVQGYRALLSSSLQIELIDSAPFGVTVDAEQTLGAALREIEQALA